MVVTIGCKNQVYTYVHMSKFKKGTDNVLDVIYHLIFFVHGKHFYLLEISLNNVQIIFVHAEGWNILISMPAKKFSTNFNALLSVGKSQTIEWLHISLIIDYI